MLPVLIDILGRLKLSATSLVKPHIGSTIKQETGSFPLRTWPRQSRNGSMQLELSKDMIFVESGGRDEEDKPSSINRNSKCGNLLGSTELKWAWMIAMGKPFEWRTEARWSIGVTWPWKGKGNNSSFLLPPFIKAVLVAFQGQVNLRLTEECCVIHEAGKS